MTRRRTMIVVLGAAIALIAVACGGSSTGTSAPASAGQPSAAQSAAPGNGASVAIPSFSLPNDDKGLEALLPVEICGVKALKFSFSGDRFLTAAADPTYAAVLAQLGKTPRDVSMAVAAGITTGTCDTGAGVFRVNGIDANRLRDVYLAESAKEGNATIQKSVGGKEVYVTTGDTNTYAYFKGDAMFFVTADDETAAALVLKEMP